MNRIFDPEPAIDLDQGEAASPSGRPLLPPAFAAGAGTKSPTRTVASPTASRREQPLFLLAVLGGVCMVSAASSVLYLSHWNRMQQSLRQERNLLLVERLRSLGPATPIAATPRDPSPTPLPGPRAGHLPAETATTASAADDLPPPPPEEPWMEQLAELPAAAPSPQPLRVPVSTRLAAPAPPAPAPAPVASAGPVPELLGVVGAPGKAGSAIFQMGGTSSNVGVGESIGSSGWRLRSAEGDSVLIERSGVVRRISIGSGT